MKTPTLRWQGNLLVTADQQLLALWYLSWRTSRGVAREGWYVRVNGRDHFLTANRDKQLARQLAYPWASSPLRQRKQP